MLRNDIKTIYAKLFVQSVIAKNKIFINIYTDMLNVYR